MKDDYRIHPNKIRINTYQIKNKGTHHYKIELPGILPSKARESQCNNEQNAQFFIITLESDFVPCIMDFPHIYRMKLNSGYGILFSLVYGHDIKFSDCGGLTLEG